MNRILYLDTHIFIYWSYQFLNSRGSFPSVEENLNLLRLHYHLTGFLSSLKDFLRFLKSQLFTILDFHDQMALEQSGKVSKIL